MDVFMMWKKLHKWLCIMQAALVLHNLPGVFLMHTLLEGAFYLFITNFGSTLNKGTFYSKNYSICRRIEL